MLIKYLRIMVIGEKRMDDDLIKKFVDVQHETEQLLDQEKVSEAKQKYLQVLDAYQAIDRSSLEKYHKELAYDQVTALFRKVNDAKEKLKVPVNLIVAAVLIIGLSIAVFFNPSIVGLIGFEDLARQPINLTLTESGIHQFTLKDRPLTLWASGSYTGKAKLFFKQGNKLELLLDTELLNNGSFTDVCEDTCEVNADANTIELFASLEPGSRLELSELTYKIERKTNSAPAWKGSSRSFNAQVAKPVTIDLADYFSDAENDQLVFLSTTADGLDVMVQESKLTITAKAAGDKQITIVASDLVEVTRVGVTISVQ